MLRSIVIIIPSVVLGLALVGMLIILALTAEVTLPVKESPVDSLLRGLDNK
jgi:hypothetical protein